jgi:hypothetical protein
MHSNISILSTDMVADTFDGASPTSSTKQWIPSQWNKEGRADRNYHYWIQLKHDASGSTFTASAQYEGEPSEADFLRLASHYLIEELPDQEMQELVAWLHETREFYRPGIRQLKASTQPAARVFGRLVDQERAAPLYVSEE